MSELEETTLEERGVEGGPPKPRRVGGWGDEKGKRRRDTVEEDERLQVPESFDDDDDLPVIPDLEAVQEEDLTTQIAAPPSLTVNRLVSFRELEADIQKQNFTLGGVDLKLLSKVLSPETDVTEEDAGWEWERLFAEMSSDIQRVWRRREPKDLSQPVLAKTDSTP